MPIFARFLLDSTETMDRFNQYSIPFAGLAMGNHQFEYEIDDRFFELFEHSVIRHAKVHIDLDFEKASTMLTLTFRIKGCITLNCDRCLDDFDMPVDTTEVMLVRFGEPGKGETDDIIVIGHGEHHLNVAPHIYDYLCLQVPIRAVHPEDENGESGCDPEIIRRISESAPKEPDAADPRWDALKKLKGQ